MPVAQAASASTKELHFLPVVGYLAKVFAGIGIEHDCAAWHFDGLVFTVFAEAPAGRAALPVSGKDVAAVSQWEEGPHVFITTKDDVPSTPSVTSVGTSLGYIFCTVEMERACTAFARAAKDFNIVYEV